MEAVMCKLCGNKTWCTAKAYVKDGVMLSFAGDPENAASGGKLCNRGQAAMMNALQPLPGESAHEAHQPEEGSGRGPGLGGDKLGRGL